MKLKPNQTLGRKVIQLVCALIFTANPLVLLAGDKTPDLALTLITCASGKCKSPVSFGDCNSLLDCKNKKVGTKCTCKRISYSGVFQMPHQGKIMSAR